MTSQTKKFVEISDILALHIECGHCKSVVSTPIASFQSVPQSCANCGTPFVGLDSPRALMETFNAIIAAFNRTERIASHHKFKVLFEIKVDATPTVSQAPESER